MITKKIIFTPFSSYRFTLDKASGSFLFSGGKRYIDFTSGWNVVNLGWNNPEIVAAGMSKMKGNTYVPMWALDEAQERYASNLLSALGSDLGVVARANAGVEVVEMALKTARFFTGRKKILSFYEQYHGSSLNALSLSYREEWMERLSDIRSDIVHLEYPNTYRTSKSDKQLLLELEAGLEEKLSSGDVAAVITEAGIISGFGHTYTAPTGFIEVVRKITKKYKTLLILDEVGTGFSRMGFLFACRHFKIYPDMVLLAKAISNGSAPIAAIATTREVGEATWSGTNLQSTFGWNPVACAIADKVLEIHKRDKVWKMAKEKGKYVRELLRKRLRDNPFVGDIRGWGLEIGLDLVKDKKTKEKNSSLVKKVVDRAFAKGLHLVCDGDSNIQLMPPLTIKQNVLDKGLDILIETIVKLS